MLKLLLSVYVAGVMLMACAPGKGSGPPSGPTPVTYYLDDTGGDDANAGTSQAAPWKTLARANAAILGPSDRLLAKRGGRWTGTLSMDESGTDEHPITIGSFGSGSLPIVSGGKCLSLAGSYLILRELQVDNCSFAGITISGSHNRVEQSLVTNNVAGVYVRSGATDNRIMDNELKNNNRLSPDGRSGAFGILLRGDRNDVARNVISESDAPSPDYGRDGAAIEVYGGRSNRIHHNIAVDNDAFSELGHSRSADNTYAYNLVRSRLPASVFLVTRGAHSGYGPVLRTRLFNNTVYLTGSRSQGFVCHAGCSPDILTMRNNIIQAGWKVGYADEPFDEDYDVFFGGIVQFSKGSNSQVANPVFADVEGVDFRLAAFSPAIDKGVNNPGYQKDLAGGAVAVDGDGDGRAVTDPGAYEFARKRER